MYRWQMNAARAAAAALALGGVGWPAAQAGTPSATLAAPLVLAASATADTAALPLRGEAAAPQRVQLQVPAGDVVSLRFTGDGLHLDLRDARGRHLRRLAESGRGVQTSMWRSAGVQGEQLWVVPAGADTAPKARPFVLELLQTWHSDGAQPLPDSPTPLGPRLQALQQVLAQARAQGDAAAAQAATAAFWREVQAHGTPLVEPWDNGQMLVTFLWRGPAQQNVRMFGGPSGHVALQRLPDTDVWWSAQVMDARARISYALAPDVPQVQEAAMQRRMILATLQRDPLNRQPYPAQPWGGMDDIHRGRSALALPQAPAQPWVAARAGLAQGQLARHVVHSQILGNDRDVWTYVPAGAEAEHQPPQALLVLFDAHAYVHDVPTPRILDNLVADGLLPRTAAVIVGNASPEARGDELPPNPLFARFMAEELMPWVHSQGLGQLARHTVVAGSSYGGLVSSYLALTHPELFGNVLSLSGSYWWAPQGESHGWMQRAWHDLPAPLPSVRFYLNAGWYERSRAEQAGILETNRELAEVLRARGLSVVHSENVSGHDYLHWQGALGCGLVALLAPDRYDLNDPRLGGCQGVPQEAAADAATLPAASP